jgi:hypothetical protein
MRSRSLAKLQAQGIIFLVAGLTLLLFISGLISPTLYVLPLGIALALIGASVFLESKERQFKIGREFIYPLDEDLV